MVWSGPVRSVPGFNERLHSNSVTSHAEHLKIVFQRIRDAGLTLRGAKCHVGLPSVHYLGHVFSGKGMPPDPSKIQDITDWPCPTNPTEVRQFLGLASYYRRYILNFSNIAAPLYLLTQNNVPFLWDEACNKAFIALKTHLMQAPILVLTLMQMNSSCRQMLVQWVWVQFWNSLVMS